MADKKKKKKPEEKDEIDVLIDDLDGEGDSGEVNDNVEEDDPDQMFIPEVVKLNTIGVDPDNRKADTEKVTELAKSITDLGSFIPIIVDKEGIIIDGERRFRALKKNKAKEALVIRCNYEDRLKIEQLQLAVNWTRENFNTDHMKKILQRYPKKTQKELALMFGMSQATVSRIIGGEKQGQTKKKKETKTEKPKKKETVVKNVFSPAEGVNVQVNAQSVIMSFELSNEVTNKSYDDIFDCIKGLFGESQKGLKKQIEKIRKKLK